MRILFIAIILACILFAGAVFIVSKTQTAKSIDESVCDEIYNINLENICHLLISGNINSCNDVGGYDTFCFDSVLEVSDISEGFCNIINNSYGKLKCYNNLAIKTENPDFCMDNEDCYIMLASVSLNEKICDFFTDGVVERNMCMAGANGNEEYCQNIENDFQRRLCLMKFSQEPDECILVDDQYDTDCLIKLASKNEDVRICKLINSENLQIKCALNVKNDFNVCEGYTGNLKHICIIYYLKNEIGSG